MNKKLTAEELSARIHDLLSEGKAQEAIELCNEIDGPDNDRETRITVLLMRAYSHMAAGNASEAVSDHVSAFRAADDLTAIEQFGLAEDAMKAGLPCDYCSELFYQAGTCFQEEGEASMAAGSFNKAGICLFRHGAPTGDEKRCFQKALDVLETGDLSDEPPERSEILTALIQSNLAECLTREGNDAQAIELYTQAAAVFGRHLGKDGDMCLTHYAICQRCLSDLYRNNEENIRAHTCLSQSITEMERRRNRLSEPLRLHLAVCYNARGTLRFQMGNYEGEVEDCTQSLLLREDLENDPSAMATVISNRAEAYTMLGHFEPAREDFIRSIEILDSIEDDPVSAISAATRCYSLGLLYTEQNCIDEACETFRSAAERLAALRGSCPEGSEYSEEQLIDLESLARMRLGGCILRCEELDYYDALTEGREAIRLIKTLPLTPDRAARLAALHISIGELMETFDELESAQREYDLADEYRQEISSVLSDSFPDYQEEDEYEEFQNEGSIWEDFSGSAPQG